MPGTKNQKSISTVSRTDIVNGLHQAGLKSGDVVFIHSAMRTFGYIEGGAQTVVKALLEVLGPSGTLVAPTTAGVKPDEQLDADGNFELAIADPASDPSGLGAVTEAIRAHPQAMRNRSRISHSAIGRRAEMITHVDPKLPLVDLRSTFGVMLALNAQVLLLGVTYANSTSHHLAEWICDVPYRHTVPLKVKLRLPDGTIVEHQESHYRPKIGKDGYGKRRMNYNRLGRILEERGLVSITSIGNAVVRRFAMRDLIDLAQIEATKDHNIFLIDENKPETDLDFGKIVFSKDRKTVFTKEMLDSAERSVKYTQSMYRWSVMDEKKIFVR